MMETQKLVLLVRLLLLIFTCFVCFALQAQVVLMGILTLAIINFFIGYFIPPSDEKKSRGFLGPDSTSFGYLKYFKQLFCMVCLLVGCSGMPNACFQNQ